MTVAKSTPTNARSVTKVAVFHVLDVGVPSQPQRWNHHCRPPDIRKARRVAPVVAEQLALSSRGSRKTSSLRRFRRSLRVVTSRRHGAVNLQQAENRQAARRSAAGRLSHGWDSKSPVLVDVAAWEVHRLAPTPTPPIYYLLAPEGPQGQ